MKSLLIKDTTLEERKQIVADALLRAHCGEVIAGEMTKPSTCEL